MIEPDPLQRNGAVAAIIAHVSTIREDLLREMHRMEDDSAARWEAHLADYRTLKVAVEEHHHAAEKEDFIAEARVRPIRAGFGWLWHHWRDLVLLVIGVTAGATFIVDAFTRVR